MDVVMSLKNYLIENERRYNYRIKTVVPLEEDQLDVIERCIMKYVPVEMSRVRKTIIQENPLDFTDVKNAEVYTIDIVVTLPASAYVLQQELKYTLGIPEKFIVVRAENDPIERQSQQIVANNEMDADAKNDGMMRSALLTQPDYPEAPNTNSEDYYGNKFVTKFLDYLYQVEQEGKTEKVDAPNSLFKWIDMPKDDTIPEDTFNDEIKDAPRSASDRRNGKPINDEIDLTNTSRIGNLDDECITYKRVYTKKDGGRIVMKREPDTLRKDS